MKYKTHNDKQIGIGGHLIGSIDCSYDLLIKKFGQTSDCYDDFKSDAEWQIEFSDGVTCCIYNYKDGKNYLGDDGLETKDITDWHIGGTDRIAVDRLEAIINETTITLIKAELEETLSGIQKSQKEREDNMHEDKDWDRHQGWVEALIYCRGLIDRKVAVNE